MFANLHRPRLVDGQRATALRFGDPRAQALLAEEESPTENVSPTDPELG